MQQVLPRFLFFCVVSTNTTKEILEWHRTPPLLEAKA